MDDAGAEPLAEHAADTPPIQDNAAGENPEPPRLPPLVPEVPPTPEHQREPRHQCRPDQTPAWKIILEVGALALGLAFAWIYRGQWDEMKKNTIATQQAVCVASRTLDETVRSNKTQEAANKLAAQTTLAHIQLDERAWVEIDDPKLSANPNFPGLTAFLYSFYLKNVGKTSAHNIRLWFDTPAESGNFFADKAAINQFQLPIDILKRKYIESVHQVFRGPNVKVGFNPQYATPGVLAPGVRTNTPSLMDVIAPQTRKGQIPAVFFSYLTGRVEYSDTFGKPHWMNFCFYIADDKGKIETCQYGNDEDPTPNIEPSPTVSAKQPTQAPCPVPEDPNQ
jgi:hypothetical protein